MGGVECPEEARYPAADGKEADGPGSQENGADGSAANGCTGVAAAEGPTEGESSRTAANEALEAFRRAVLDVRALRGQENVEGAMEEAKLRLAQAMRNATAAGVSQADLVTASAAPAEEEAAAAEAVNVGDQAEIVGLESESGKRLNGMVGLVQEYLEDKGRFRLELGPDNVVSIKQANLRKWPRPQPQPEREEAGEEADEPLKVGDRVEIGGLESESGKKLNGRLGWILEFIADSGRFKLELTPGEFVSVKPANLNRFVPEPPPDDSRQRSPSNSSSSSSKEKRKKKKEKKRKRPLTPEEVLENLVKTEERAAKKAARSARDAGAAAAAAAGAAAPQAEGAEAAAGADASAHAPEGAERDPGCAGPGTSVPVDPTLAAAAAAASAAVAAGNAAKAAAAAAAANIQAGMQQQQQQQQHSGVQHTSVPAAQPAQPERSLRPGDRVEVHGLQSAAGRPLNGKTGMIIKFAEDKGRWQVELGLANLQSLKPENLRLCQAPAASFTMEDGYLGSTAGYTLL